MNERIVGRNHLLNFKANMKHYSLTILRFLSEVELYNDVDHELKKKVMWR